MNLMNGTKVKYMRMKKIKYPPRGSAEFKKITDRCVQGSLCYQPASDGGRLKQL